MKIYLAWSGNRSKAVAQAFKQWLPRVIQSLDPFFSPDDIEKGARWSSELSSLLEHCQVGLLLLTPENQFAPWLLFEAGALSKTPDSRVICVTLDGVEPSQPLSQFQNVAFAREEMEKLIEDIRSWSGVPSPSISIVRDAFELQWGRFELEVQQALLIEHVDRKVVEPEFGALLNEILGLARLNSKTLSALSTRLEIGRGELLLGINDPPFHNGQLVVHRTYGQGVVMESKRIRDDFEILVAFKKGGVKKMVQKLARLTAVEQDFSSIEGVTSPASSTYDRLVDSGMTEQED
jgi:hypothetical protein